MSNLSDIISRFETEEELLAWAREAGLTAHPLVLSRLREVRPSPSSSSTIGKKCPHCDKVFPKSGNLNRHVRSVHENDRYSCPDCGKTFSRADNRQRHKCSAPLERFQCGRCEENFASAAALGSHFHYRHRERGAGPSTSSPPVPSASSSNTVHRRGPSSTATSTAADNNEPGPSYSCRTCQQHFDDRHQLYNHQMAEGHRRLFQVGGEAPALQERPWADGRAPWENEDGEIMDPELNRVYDINAPHILARHDLGDVLSTFNFPITNDFSVSGLMDRAQEIYDRSQNSFRLNLSFGVVLRNVETGRYRYFHPFANDPLFQRPIYVTNQKDLERLRSALERMDITAYLLKQRPDSKWKPVLITNVNFYVYRSNFPLGFTPEPLPSHIKNHKAILSLERNFKNGKLYQDNLCAFRCLALHRDPSGLERLGRPTRELYSKWVVYCRDNRILCLDKVKPEDFPGLEFTTHIPHFEKCFEVDISVFSLDKAGIATPKYKSRGIFNNPLNLNLHEGHLSFIKNINLYCRRYRCPSCEKLFRTTWLCSRHQRKCEGQTKLIFLGGFHQTNKSIFVQLEEYGVRVEEAERNFPWFIVFDFEALLHPVEEGRQSDKLLWTQEHRPISVSICSNVNGYEKPHCIVNEDMDQLLAKMFQYMTTIKDAVKELSCQRWGHALTDLQEQLDALGPEDEETSGMFDGRRILRKNLATLYGKLKGYCSQVPVLGYNSGKYDLNLIKRKVARHLVMHDPENHPFTVKKNNTYLCLSNGEFKFLDITQYLAPGTSYSQFLKAYGVEMSKGFWPYDYLTSLDKLAETSLPPLGDAWYSALKQKSVLDDGLKTPEENYAWLQEVWERENMSTLRDFLVWYNNLDVGPFVEAVSLLQGFYFDQGIDLFKTTMSVPGVARQKLFETSRQNGATFALFDSRNADLYHTIKQNVVGGPSLIFTRHHKAGQTFIRQNPQKSCGRVVGYDANALYLWAIDQAMPTGPFIRREAGDGFKPVVRDKYMTMFHWMDWLNQQSGLDVRHKLNWGREKRIGPYLVDGFVPLTKTVYSFHGCYFHGHACYLTAKARTDEKKQKLLEERSKRTAARKNFLERSGYKVVEMRECQFNKMRLNEPELQAFIDSRRPAFYRKHKKCVTEQQILKGVESGELFGMVEVDIRVPERWCPGRRPYDTELTPHQYYEEMCPLFCNTEVPFEAIGDHMQQHVLERCLSTKPRQLLVGGMKARKMLIATPLLQWYLRHGMVVDRVYRVIEYTPSRCFRQFVSEVSSTRREADIDPSKAIRGDTTKLLGNSAFGSLLLNLLKHGKVIYVRGQIAACRQVNEAQFQRLTELEDNYFEVEKGKKRIRLDMPIQLGYFILQYAKLRMLQFYYDFMDIYVDRSDFEYCEMDTDSAYMALSAECLADVIKPERKADYDRGLNGFCHGENISADAEYRWFPRTCCIPHAKFDLRVQGLFKLEFSGDEVIGLCSKCYVVGDTTCVGIDKPKPTSLELASRRISRLARGRLASKVRAVTKPCRIGRVSKKVKFSCKGISKRTVKAPLLAYRRVLENRIAGSGMNRGFRVKCNKVFTYEQIRHGLSYFYCKRRVHDDGVHTSPLGVELCPWPSEKQKLDDTDTFLVELLNSNFEG